MQIALPNRSGIYGIQHVPSRKLYIGSSANIGKRVYEHMRLLKKGIHKNEHLQSAFTKYGAPSFKCFVIEDVEDKSQLFAVEREYIHEAGVCDRLVGYNKSSEPQGAQLGLIRSDETCAKIGASKIGNKNRTGIGFSDEAKRKISASLTGKKASPEAIAKMSAFQKGRKKTPEWCAKISQIHKGHIVSQETRDKISASLLKRNAKLRDLS